MAFRSIRRGAGAAVLVVLMAAVPSTATGRPDQDPAPQPSVDVVLDTQVSPTELDAGEVDEGVDEYVELESDTVLDAVVSSPGSAASEGACRDLAARDLDVRVRDEVVSFVGVEASRCNPGGQAAAGYVSWHGQRTNGDGSVLASASLSVLLDRAGAATQTTGTITLATETIEIMPVDGDIYSLTVVGDSLTDDEPVVDDPPPAETATPTTEPEATTTTTTATPAPGPPATTTTTAAGETTGTPTPGETSTTAVAGDELPGGPGDAQPVEPTPEDLSGVVGDGADDVAPGSIDGGQPRPGGPGGNRTITVRFAYANGITANAAYLYMVNRTQQTNDAFINSAMPVRVQADGPVAAGYTQDTTAMKFDLDHLSKPSDLIMDDVRADWASSDIDALALMVPNPTANVCGIGYLSTSVEANASMLSVSSMGGGCDYTFSHELGHNLSGHHNPENASSTTTAFPWSYGHYVTGKGRTIMSYANPCGTTGCVRKAQYSDPGDDLIGWPGTPSGTAYRDNDRSITDTAWASSQTGDESSNDHLWYHNSSGHSDVNVNASTGDDIEAPFTPISGDFNGDGRNDQFWYFPGRPAERLWMFNAATGSYTAYTKDITGAYRPAVGDFDGDGRDDIFWHGPGTAPDLIWWGDASPANFGTTTTTPSIQGSYSPTAGDLNGDGRDDLFWYAPGSAPDAIWPGNASRSAFTTGTGAVPATVNGLYHLRTSDVNGDGLEDLVWYGPGTGSDFIWHGRSSISTIGSGYQTTFTLDNSLTPIAGDFNHDGRGDIFWYGPGSEPDSIWWGQTTMADFVAPHATTQSVSGTYEPTSGDFNGDGYDDIYWFAFG